MKLLATLGVEYMHTHSNGSNIKSSEDV